MPSATSTPLLPVDDRDHKLGADRPKMTLVEYGDFGCPYCFAAQRPLESLLDRYDELRLVWRHFPDPELHPGVDLAAEVSELAATEGKFWQAHSLLLAGRESISLEDLFSVARRLELGEEEAEKALGDHLFRKRVEEDVEGGKRAGVHGTPTFFVDGVRLEGHWRQLAQIVPGVLSDD